MRAKIESLESSGVVEDAYADRGAPTMKADLRAEIVLLNRNVDEIIGLLQCATDADIWTRQRQRGMKRTSRYFARN